MKVPFVDLHAQYLSIKNEIDNAISQIISQSAFIGGYWVKTFEENFASMLGVKHCIGVGNGTDALFIALKSLGIKHGDEVITTANSFIATPEAITQTGAKVVFVDCCETDFNIDVTKIESKITSKTKAILPVHLYGQPANMSAIKQIADKYNLFIIEDASQAHLAKIFIDDSKNFLFAGTFGDIGTFSFYPGKNLGAYGDAGAIVTNNDELAGWVRKYANHGRVSKYNHEMEGINSRLDALQAAILLVKLNHLQEWTNERRQIAMKYTSALNTLPSLICPSENEYVKHVYHLYVIRTKHRDNLKDFLVSHQIETGIHYPIALPNLEAYNYLKDQPSDFPVASQLQDEVLSLPIFPEITDKQIDYVISKIKNYFS